jgi:hypothetical protein
LVGRALTQATDVFEISVERPAARALGLKGVVRLRSCDGVLGEGAAFGSPLVSELFVEPLKHRAKVVDTIPGKKPRHVGHRLRRVARLSIDDAEERHRFEGSASDLPADRPPTLDVASELLGPRGKTQVRRIRSCDPGEAATEGILLAAEVSRK